ncbi:MAG: hypothetical protein FWC15_03740 [Fibromonadales bacterium]|nr:hypothetical protein [Fibromonadales bacterium]
MKTTRFLLAAGASLAFTLTFSCSSGGGSDPDPQPSSSSRPHGSSSSAEELCAGAPLAAGYFCLDGAPELKCNGSEFTADVFCLNNKQEPKCGGAKFNEKEYCLDNQVKGKCGGISEGAQPGAGEACCDNTSPNKYTVATQFCSNGNVIEKCDSKVFDPSVEFCFNGTTLEDLCGGHSTWIPGQKCIDGEVKSVCGPAETEYDPADEFCLDGTPTPLCDGDKFTTAQFCYSDVVRNKCGGTLEYNPDDESCCGNGIYTLDTESCCGSTKYTLDTQRCYNSSQIVDRCGINPNAYNPDVYECKSSNGIFLKAGKPTDGDGVEYEAVLIGTKVWMARNLNYDGPDDDIGACYDDNTSNCVTYGRLYDWDDAQNVCPDGWHLPSDAEWTALTTAVGGTGTNGLTGAGDKLKAESGWANNSGTDDFGFSALPGGIQNSTGFHSVSDHGVWWSGTADGSFNAYYRIMNYNNSNVGRSSENTFNLYSVRCVQD